MYIQKICTLIFLYSFILILYLLIVKIILENCLSEVLPEGDWQRCVKVICISQNKYTIEE